jgi:hypothetical protein
VEVKNLATSYTSNQAGVIACGLAGVMWAFTLMAAYLTWVGAVHPFYIIINILGWILFPLIVKKVTAAYIVGIIVWIIYIIGDLAISSSLLPGQEWWRFTSPNSYPYLVAWIIGIAFIYFAYKSYMELKK